jgi:hypothetical protein
MSHVSHKLLGSFEGALAGGGDPATSPLYVLDPFSILLLWQESPRSPLEPLFG